jgi:hypothetical protein
MQGHYGILLVAVVPGLTLKDIACDYECHQTHLPNSKTSMDVN